VRADALTPALSHGEREKTRADLCHREREKTTAALSHRGTGKSPLPMGEG